MKLSIARCVTLANLSLFLTVLLSYVSVWIGVFVAILIWAVVVTAAFTVPVEYGD